MLGIRQRSSEKAAVLLTYGSQASHFYFLVFPVHSHSETQVIREYLSQLLEYCSCLQIHRQSASDVSEHPVKWHSLSDSDSDSHTGYCVLGQCIEHIREHCLALHLLGSKGGAGLSLHTTRYICLL